MERQRAVWSMPCRSITDRNAGIIIAYVQYDQKKDAMAQATAALNAQEQRVMDSYNRSKLTWQRSASMKNDQREHV